MQWTFHVGYSTVSCQSTGAKVRFTGCLSTRNEMNPDKLHELLNLYFSHRQPKVQLLCQDNVMFSFIRYATVTYYQCSIKFYLWTKTVTTLKYGVEWTVGKSLIVLSGLPAIQVPSLCMSSGPSEPFCAEWQLQVVQGIGTHTLEVHGQCLSCPKVLPCSQVRMVRTNEQASKGLTGKLVGRVWAYRVPSGSLPLHKSRDGSARLNSLGYVMSWGQPGPQESLLRKCNQKKKKVLLTAEKQNKCGVASPAFD